MTEALDRTAIAQIAERIRQRLHRLKLSPRAASLSTNRGPDVIRNLLRAADAGKPYNPRGDTLDSIARVLSVSPVWLRYGQVTESDPQDVHDDSKDFTGLIYSNDNPKFMGICETDVFRVVFSCDEDLGYLPPVGVDPRYSKAQQGVWLVRGSGMAKMGIIDGMFIVGVFYKDYTRTVGPLIHGMFVIVERTQDEGLYVETGVREYRVWPDKIEFVAHSPTKDHVPIVLEHGWASSEYPFEIIAVVAGAHIPFENEGFLPHYD